MSYNYRIPQVNLYDAYNTFVAGEPAKGRRMIEKYYESGLNNPRACLFEAAKEVNKLNIWADEWDAVLRTTIPKKELEARKQLHRSTINEMIYPQDRGIQNALNNVNTAFHNQYPSTRSMSEYIINREFIPEFRVFRKFAKIMFR